MATKAKTPAPSAAPETTLELRLAAAISLMEAGKPEALSTLEAVAEAASTLGQVRLMRTARNYVAVLQRRASVAPAMNADSEMDATLLINSKRAEDALPVLERALAAHKDRGQLHYLHALALVQLTRFEDAAKALKQAFALEASLQHQYQMEPDFHPARRQACFAEFELL